MDEFILGLIFMGIMVVGLVPWGMKALKIDINDIETNPIMGGCGAGFVGCGAGFVVGVVSLFLAIGYDFLLFVPFPFIPLVGGVVAGGLVEGKRQRGYGRISIMPIVEAAIVGGIGAVIATFLFWAILGGQ